MRGKMSGKIVFVALAVAATMVVPGSPSAAWARYNYDREGPRVTPCSLVGVNPVYHPEIFGNPAFAKAYYGFVRAQDHTWHVMPNCTKPAFIGPN